MPDPIRVMIVDDHDMVRRGISIFLQSFKDFTLVGEAVDGKEAVQLCDDLQPDVILMDIMMPHMDGITATRLIRQAHPQTKIIALTSANDHDSVEKIFEAGAANYLFKGIAMDELADAIYTATA